MSNDDTQPASGSGWEPTEPTEPTEPPPAAAPPAYAAPAPAAKPRRVWPLLAGAAAGIALVAGLAGFGIAQATDDDGRGHPPAGFGPDPHRHGPGEMPGDQSDGGPLPH
jgi:hypothetical protein